MDCSRIREALSARLDGEDPGVAGAAVDRHVQRCCACGAWEGELSTLHRLVRVREAEAIPDLTAAILAPSRARVARRGPLQPADALEAAVQG